MTREEAIKKVRWGLLGLVIDKDVRDAFETLIPELRESEDERIRKALIWHLKADADFVSNGVTKAECISWLERQKEKKWNDTAIKDGDDDEKTRKKLISLINWSGTPWDERDKDKFIEYLEMQKEQKPAEWSEEDERIIAALTKALIGSDSAEKIMLFDGVTIEMVSDWLKSLPMKCPKSSDTWKPSELEKGALRTAIHILTDERSFPKAATQLQNILDAFE